MALRGNLKDFSLPDIFQLVTFSRKTGVLRIQRDDGAEGTVWFRDGDVFFAQSNWNHELLGNRLVRTQRITPQALDRALKLHAAEPEDGRRLGRILVDEGYITERVLESFVQEQIQDSIFDLMRWEDGEFDFEQMPEVVEQDIGLSVSIENIVMEGSRRLEEWNRIRKKIPSADIVFKMATAPGEGTFEISLRPVEWSLLLLVDGSRSVAELATDTGHTDFEVARILYGLFSAGLLEFASDEEAARLRAERFELEAKRAAAEAKLRVEQERRAAEAAVAAEAARAEAELAASEKLVGEEAAVEAPAEAPTEVPAEVPAVAALAEEAAVRVEETVAPIEEPEFLGVAGRPSEQDVHVLEEMMTLLKPAAGAAAPHEEALAAEREVAEAEVAEPVAPAAAEAAEAIEAPAAEIEEEVTAPSEEAAAAAVSEAVEAEEVIASVEAVEEISGLEVEAVTRETQPRPEALEETIPAEEVSATPTGAAEVPPPFEFDLTELGDLLSYDRLQGISLGTTQVRPEVAPTEAEVPAGEPPSAEVEEVVLELKPVPPLEIPSAEAPAAEERAPVETAESAAVSEVVEVEWQGLELEEPTPPTVVGMELGAETETAPEIEVEPEVEVEPEIEAGLETTPEVEVVREIQGALETEAALEVEVEPEIEYVVELEPETEIGAVPSREFEAEEVSALASIVPEIEAPEVEGLTTEEALAEELEVDFASLGLDVLAQTPEERPEAGAVSIEEPQAVDEVVEPMSMVAEAIPPEAAVEAPVEPSVETAEIVEEQGPTAEMPAEEAPAGVEEVEPEAAVGAEAPGFETIMETLDHLAEEPEPEPLPVSEGFDADLLAEEEAPAGGVISTAGYMEDIESGLGLSTGLGDELSALTGAQRRRRARPTARVSGIPEPGPAKIGLDRRLDKDTLLKIIDGIKNL